LAQSGLYPANCRLLDATEAMLNGAAAGDTAVLLIAFESADHNVAPSMQRALELARQHGGSVPDGAGAERAEGEGARDGAAGAWRSAFLGAPYLRDALVGMGMITETFETAITWDRFEAFHAAVMDATADAVRRVCGRGTVTCRFTHAYPDGPAPYYSVIAPGRAGAQLEQWAEIKTAASVAIISGGGTITQHHAVGRDHRPWYDQQRPDGFAAALRAAKHALDPAAILNPGVLFDPLPAAG
jgi:alkyldihydroxyacetonephosphate synthase